MDFNRNEVKEVMIFKQNHHFLTGDGLLTEEIMPDMLYPNEIGYRLWAGALRPYLMDLLD